MTHRIVADIQGFGPDNVVLETQGVAEGLRDIHGYPGVGIYSSHVEEERSAWGQDAGDLPANRAKPIEIFLARSPVVIAAIGHADIVGRRCDGHVYALIG